MKFSSPSNYRVQVRIKKPTKIFIYIYLLILVNHNESTELKRCVLLIVPSLRLFDLHCTCTAMYVQSSTPEGCFHIHLLRRGKFFLCAHLQFEF